MASRGLCLAGEKSGHFYFCSATQIPLSALLTSGANISHVRRLLSFASRSCLGPPAVSPSASRLSVHLSIPQHLSFPAPFTLSEEVSMAKAADRTCEQRALNSGSNYTSAGRARGLGWSHGRDIEKQAGETLPSSMGSGKAGGLHRLMESRA